MSERIELSIVTPAKNEAENLRELVVRVAKSAQATGRSYEHIVIDNASNDHSEAILRELCKEFPKLKVIFNVSDFGHLRSPYHALMQAAGNAVVVLPSDLEDPPELIPSLVEEWERGAWVVMLVRQSSTERGLLAWARSFYYFLLSKMASSTVIPNATGTGIYDRRAIEVLRSLRDPQPYVRGLIFELGFPVAFVNYHQEKRARYRSKNSLADLFQFAILGITSTSRTPLRIMSVSGLIVASMSTVAAFYFLIRKLLSWSAFELGLAPIAIGLFLLGAIQIACLGILGEYVGNIFGHVRQHPYVVERERLNFGDMSPKDQDTRISPLTAQMGSIHRDESDI
jgi:glycosyltransferase involved in cell wall biosynthesis